MNNRFTKLCSRLLVTLEAGNLPLPREPGRLSNCNADAQRHPGWSLPSIVNGAPVRTDSLLEQGVELSVLVVVPGAYEGSMFKYDRGAERELPLF